MSSNGKRVSAALSSLLFASAFSGGLPAHAGNAGAFLGGMVTSKVINNMERRTDAEEAQAYDSAPPTQTVVVAPAEPAAQTPEQRIQQLDKLAAGGYITPAEYKAKKKAILDGM
jgi:hypothetical protein